MVSERFNDAYVPPEIPESDLEFYDRAGMGRRVGWGDRPAVLVVDLTRQFSDESWPLGRSDTGDACVEANVELIAAAREHGVPVVYVKGREAGDSIDGFGAERVSKSVGSHFDPGEGNEIRPEIAPGEDEVVVRKPRRSAFFGTMVDTLFREQGIDTVILTGMVTSGCVRSTAVSAFQRDYRVIVPEECVADRAEVPHRVSLYDIDMKFGDVTPLAEVVETLDELDRRG